MSVVHIRFVRSSEKVNDDDEKEAKGSLLHFTEHPEEQLKCIEDLMKGIGILTKIIRISTKSEDGVFFRVFYRNLSLLHLRFLLLAFTVLLRNKHTSLAENGENLISAQPRISAHYQGPKI